MKPTLTLEIVKCLDQVPRMILINHRIQLQQINICRIAHALLIKTMVLHDYLADKNFNYRTSLYAKQKSHLFDDSGSNVYHTKTFILHTTESISTLTTIHQQLEYL